MVAYLEKLLSELETAKSQGRNGIYKINEKISDDIGVQVKEYFENKPEYYANIRKCMTCNGTWDILIKFIG
jgi:hypothetical protein